MAVNPVKSVSTFSIRNTREAKDERQQTQGKNTSKNRKKTPQGHETEPHEPSHSEPLTSFEAEMYSQPIDTEKVLELLSHKIISPVMNSLAAPFKKKTVKKLNLKKIDRLC